MQKQALCEMQDFFKLSDLMKYIFFNVFFKKNIVNFEIH